MKLLNKLVLVLLANGAILIAITYGPRTLDSLKQRNEDTVIIDTNKNSFNREHEIQDLLDKSKKYRASAEYNPGYSAYYEDELRDANSIKGISNTTREEVRSEIAKLKNFRNQYLAFSKDASDNMKGSAKDRNEATENVWPKNNVITHQKQEMNQSDMPPQNKKQKQEKRKPTISIDDTKGQSKKTVTENNGKRSGSDSLISVKKTDNEKNKNSKPTIKDSTNLSGAVNKVKDKRVNNADSNSMVSKVLSQDAKEKTKAYAVKKGESLAGIAAQFQMRIPELMELNPQITKKEWEKLKKDKIILVIDHTKD